MPERGVTTTNEAAAWTQLTSQIDAVLREHGTPERAQREKAYLKSRLEHYGATVPDIRAVVKAAAAQHPEVSREDLVRLVDAMWATPVHERRMAAVELLALYQARLNSYDAPMLERLLRTSHTWALVDPLAESIVGPLVQRHPELGVVLDRWAADQDF